MRMFISGVILLLSPLTILASPCASGTLQSYVDLGSTGCELGNRLIADFTLGPGPSFQPYIAMDPTLVTVTPGGTPLQPELLVTTPYTATSGQIIFLWFDFVLTGALNGVSAELNSPSLSGNGQVTAFLDVCPDGFFNPYAPFGCPSGALPFLSVHAGPGNDKLADSMLLPNASFYHTSLHLYVGQDQPPESASLDSVNIGFNTVPEPDVKLLTLAGLVAICFRRYLHTLRLHGSFSSQ